jgi:hypothetical protein
MNMNNRKRSRNALSGCGCLTLPLASFFFLICLIIFLVWMANSPQWQARLYGVQTQGVVKSVADDCNRTPTDPSLDPGMNGGFALRGLLPQASIEQNVLPTIEFTDRQGHHYDLQEDYCGDYGVGEQVAVWYLPAAPTTFALAQDTDSTLMDVVFPLVGMLLSLLLILASVVLLIIGAVRRRRAASSATFPGAGSSGEAGMSAGAFPWSKK